MIQFLQNCRQVRHESLEDWADRVLSLANKAFRELPEAYMNKQATLRFCQGCYDTKAGQRACTQKPEAMEAAIDTLKWYTHSRKTAQSNGHMDTSKDLLTFYSLEPITVQVTGMKKQDSEWKSNNEEKMKEVMANLKAISNQLNETPTQLLPARSRENTSLQTSSNSRNWKRNNSTGRQGSPESTRPRQSTQNKTVFSM